VGLFVLIAVGVVVAQTWLDWRDSRKQWQVPEWARGLALGGALTVCLTAVLSYASVWLQDPASSWGSAVGSRLFWPEAALLAAVMSIFVIAARKKRMKLAMFLSALLIAAYCLGVAFAS